MKSPSRAEIETILTYGLIAVVVGGGAGVYLPLTMGKNLSSDALSTYIFAMLAPFWVDTLLHEPYWKRGKRGQAHIVSASSHYTD